MSGAAIGARLQRMPSFLAVIALCARASSDLVVKKTPHTHLFACTWAIPSLYPPFRCCRAVPAEYLERGSLYNLLHRNTVVLPMNLRVQMALDIARGLRAAAPFFQPVPPRCSSRVSGGEGMDCRSDGASRLSSCTVHVTKASLSSGRPTLSRTRCLFDPRVARRVHCSNWSTP